jgi:pimeloyl-ACP methyl ester carboxylesterase
MDGDGDGVTRAGGARDHARHFKGHYERRVVPLVGHNLPQEAPKDFAQAVIDVLREVDGGWRMANGGSKR